jgi:hypothetical protein
MHVRFSGCLHKLIDTDNMIVFHVDNKGYTPLMRLFEPASSLKGEDRKAIGYDDEDVDDCVRLMLDYMPICNRARMTRLREANKRAETRDQGVGAAVPVSGVYVVGDSDNSDDCEVKRCKRRRT